MSKGKLQQWIFAEAGAHVDYRGQEEGASKKGWISCQDCNEGLPLHPVQWVLATKLEKPKCFTNL